MVRAAGRLSFAVIILLLVYGAAAAQDGQIGALLPAVIDFSADVDSLNYAEIEAGTAQITLSWRTLNTNAAHRIGIDSYQGNQWRSVLESNDAPPLNGSRTITVQLPGNYGTPTYRLTLRTSVGVLVAQQFLTIPYAAPGETAPAIAEFASPVEGVDVHLVAYRNARITVSWNVENRLPDTQLYFEQLVGEEERAYPVDVKGHGVWLPSSGEGAIIPRTSFSTDDLRFRLNLVSLTDGTRYDWADIIIPVIGGFTSSRRVGTVRGPGTVVEALSVPVAPMNNIVLSAVPQVEGERQGNVVVSWQAENAATVEIVQTVTDGPKTLYIQLPAEGSMIVPAAEETVTFTLRAHSAEGEVTTGELSIISAGGE